MKNSNTEIFSKKIDNLGRVVLPKELRNRIRISADNFVAISYHDGKIIIEKKQPYCVICNNSENIKESIGICQSCIERIKNNEI